MHVLLQHTLLIRFNAIFALQGRVQKRARDLDSVCFLKKRGKPSRLLEQATLVTLRIPHNLHVMTLFQVRTCTE